MTIYVQDAKTLELPWPFTGREDELELIRRSLAATRQGIVVTGQAGCGKTRLVTEAVRGADCVRVTGTPETRSLPFAAFAPLLPETVSLHRAVRSLSGVRLLVVDDAHLLDEASAALVHQLAVHGRTRLVVIAAAGSPAPGAVSRLWMGDLLPRLALEPLPHEETARLLAGGVALEPLTVRRLHLVCRGDLRLLRDLSGALRTQGLLTGVPGTDEWAWRGPVPMTPTVRERIAGVLDRSGPGEREVLERLAFAEPLPLRLDDLDLDVLERVEADGLVLVDDHGGVRLAHPLHGPALRAGVGRLRARRLARGPRQYGPALAAEQRALARRIEEMDVRPLSAPVGEWLLAEGATVPAGYAAVRARFSRLRGELREAAAWARAGLREAPGDTPCRAELALAAAQSGDPCGTGGFSADGGPKERGFGGEFALAAAESGDSGGVDGLPAEGSLGGRGGELASAAAQLDDSGGVGGFSADGGPKGQGFGGELALAAAESGDSGGVGGLAVDASLESGHGGELALAAAQSGDSGRTEGLAADASPKGQAHGGEPALADGPSLTHGTAAWAAAARGDVDGAVRALVADADRAGDPGGAAGADDRGGPGGWHDNAYAHYDAVRLGAPELAAGRLPGDGVLARHADALARGDGPALDRAAAALEERGFLLFAAEAYAQAVRAHRDPSAARTARTRAVALARRCQGARTPALSGLVLGELTARQRQIVTLAAAGLSNRQIAERLTLSVRTVGNHLYGAYTRLGASDRGALPWLVELPDAASA
ncbi:LuxR C-terminal-related transcriptional regulator [Streptomyces sp. NPDC004752]